MDFISICILENFFGGAAITAATMPAPKFGSVQNISDRRVYVKLGIGSEAEMDFPLPLR